MARPIGQAGSFWPGAQPGLSGGGHAHADHDARERLIDAAGPLFAAKGFDGATVREIVEAAGANVAAINYHFRDKRGLYNAVLTEGYERLLRASGTAIPAPEAIPTSLTRSQAHQILRAFIAAMLERALGNREPDWLFEIMMREMIEPTEALDQMVARFIRPQHELNCIAIGSLLGREPKDPAVLRCAYSIVAQILLYKHCPAVIERLTPIDLATPAGRAALAEHICAFSLAGIDAVASSKRSSSTSLSAGAQSPLPGAHP